jgi:hypothetical protein
MGMTQDMIEAGIAALGSDDDRPTALKVADIYSAMERSSARKAENKTNKVRIDIICMALDDAAEYFHDRLDIRDGADGQQAPNDEMRLHTEIVSALHSLNGLRLSLERAEGDGSDT